MHCGSCSASNRGGSGMDAASGSSIMRSRGGASHLDTGSEG